MLRQKHCNRQCDERGETNRVSSPSAEILASHHTHDPQDMSVPAVARRKYMMHERRRRRETRNLVFGCVTLAMIIMCVFYNTRYSLSERTVHGALVKNKTRLRGSSYIAPDAQPFNHDSLASRARHLIVVAGHSVTIGGNLRDAGFDEEVWFLLDYQKNKGLPQAIVAHISAGILEAQLDPESLLIFSGGETRAVTGPLTEASSYFRVADAMELWPEKSSVRARTVTEEFATDSFENLLFSICRFKEVTGSYPNKITVVSFTFKQRRFETLHAPALRWPSRYFKYVGVDPPAYTGFNLAEASQGERENAALPFERDPYGCHSPVLQEKRRERNPFARTPPYELSCPELKALLHYCGPKPFRKSQLPWKNL